MFWLIEKGSKSSLSKDALSPISKGVNPLGEETVMASPEAIAKYDSVCSLHNSTLSASRRMKVKVLVAQSYLTLYDPMDSVARQAPLSMGFSRQES